MKTGATFRQSVGCEFKSHAGDTKTDAVFGFHKMGSLVESGICTDPSHNVLSGIFAGRLMTNGAVRADTK